MLKFNKVTKKYTKNGIRFTALEEVSFEVAKGDFVAVVGPSGSGKSTLLHTAGGLIQPDAGEVLFNGRNIYAFNGKESVLYRRKHVGFVFQQFHLMPYLTVDENIQMVCSDTLQRGRVEDYLEQCSLLPLRDKYPEELSVGEKQRTAFIRAIITQPDILLADEPTGNLDPSNSSSIMTLMEDYHKKGGTLLLVSHDSESSKYANRHIVLESGKILNE